MKWLYTRGGRAALWLLFAVGVYLSFAAGGALIFALRYEMYDRVFSEVLLAMGVAAENVAARDIASAIYARAAHYPLFAGLGAALFLVSSLLLLTGAGHRSDREEIALGWLDRVPLEVAEMGLISVSTVAVVFGLEMWDWVENLFFSSPRSGLLMAAVLVLLLTIAVLFAMLGLVTCVVRGKAGVFWKSTLLWWALRLCWRGCKWLGGAARALALALPLVWRAAVILAAAGIFFFGVAIYRLRDAALAFFTLGEVAAWAVLVAAAWQMQRLRAAAKRLAAGDLNYKLDTRGMVLDIKAHAEDLNAIGDGMARAVEARTRSERMRAELITNVSHDIKTPLTSIVNYVDLLGKAETEEDRARCLEVLTRQAARLRKLTDDLVEASKAATGNLAVELASVDAAELVRQALGEWAERLEGAGLTVVWEEPAAPIYLLADGKHLWRVVDNLLSNAAKYALAGTRVYVELTEAGEKGIIAVKNISRERISTSAEELTERFVRGDAARADGGSGLGLDIARSLMTLMGGSLRITVDGDLFKAEAALPRSATIE